MQEKTAQFMPRRLLARVRKSAFARRLTEFFYSPWYISAVALAVLLCYMLQIDAIAYILLGVCAVFVCVFCDEATPLLPLLLILRCVRSLRVRENGMTPWDVAGIVICAVFAGGAILYHLIAFGGYKRIFQWGRLGVACIVLAAGIAFGGFAYPDYGMRVVVNAGKEIAFLCALYFVLRGAIRWNKNSLTYLALCFVAVGLMGSCTLAWTYLRHKPFIDSGFQAKELLVTGWGMSNIIGPSLLQGMPLAFYLACTEEKHGWLFYCVGVLFCICTVFTYCRAAVLVGACLFVVCITFVCVKSKCRKQMWLCTLLLIALCIAMLLWNESKKIFDFYIESGMDNRGRYSIWEKGIKLFEEYPVFGTGFYSIATVGEDMSHLFHNTVVQFMAASGTVGTFAYGFYRAQTINLYTRRLTVERFFLGLTLSLVIGVSIFDNGIFHISLQAHMLLVLVFSERDLDYAVWFADCPRLGTRKPLFLR